MILKYDKMMRYTCRM